GEDPASESARAELTRLAGLAEGTDTVKNAWARIVELYEGALKDASRPLDAPLSRELLLQVAAAQDEKLGHTDAAVDAYKRVLGIEPDDTAALDALERLYTRTERWPELLEVLRKKA